MEISAFLALRANVRGRRKCSRNRRSFFSEAMMRSRPLGTLYRHFPTREALLEALLRTNFDELTAKAEIGETSNSPDEALVSWLRDVISVAHSLRGVAASMAAAIANESSALHASCVTMRAAGTRLLARAQAAGFARNDIEGSDLFALVGALAWIHDQPSFAPCADHLFRLIADTILTRQSRSDVAETTDHAAQD
jgi:AcrR family transcriptional regulator